MAKTGKPPLHIVTDLDGTGPQPSRKLGEAGLSLWNRVVSEYRVDDVAGIELLRRSTAPRRWRRALPRMARSSARRTASNVIPASRKNWPIAPSSSARCRSWD
jgi:hypothetical protein